MVQPSAATTVVFVAIVLGIVASVVAAVRYTGRRRGDPPSIVLGDTVRAALVVVAYLGLTAGVSASGVLARPGFPPPLMGFFVLSNAVAIVVAVSPLGARLADHLPVAALVGFQVFRFPLELVLHRWYLEGVLPVQMTYEGYNFDIVSGIAGGLVGLWAYKGHAPRWAIAGYNLLGLALLGTVATIAVLSSPLPIRQFHEGPPVLLALHAPYGWIVPFCVAGALAGHLIAFRWLTRS